ncbi:GerAB/ArcD/ProY family transporter [Fictibacillus iocasae]|uniref:GerAB/ArcD/ProY family transporter n=1 Tax=Fictibacillus iocasae TaxID=2715437 RepID=A0ABW2NP74_9BACL
MGPISIPVYRQVSPFFAFFIIASMQVGVGILGFERYIAQDAGHDAWVAVILSGLSVNVLIFLMYRILQHEKGDIFAIHQAIAGKLVTQVIMLYFFFYFYFYTLVVLRTYLEVIQIWMFPELKPWMFGLAVLFIAIYYVKGGFRVLAGLAFFSFLFGFPLLFLKYFTLKNSTFTNLLPFLNHSMKDYLLATKTMTLNNLGFEALLFFYPFFKDPQKSEKWAQYGSIFTTSVYLISTLTTFVYFSQGQLAGTIWPTLTLWKIVNFSFIERFEYIGVSLWIFIILPNICFGLWVCSWLGKRLYEVSQKKVLFSTSALLLAGIIFFEDREYIDRLNSDYSTIGFYTIMIYIPLLYALTWLKYRGKEKSQ